MIFAPIPKEVPQHACETVSGRYVDVVEPNPEDINLHDIAWSLSRQARYAGHTLGEPYFVAQHACFVTDLLEMALDLVDMRGHPLQQSFIRWMDERGHGEWIIGVGLTCGNPSVDGYYGRMWALMHALCHDNPEAYLVDLPSPVKRFVALREPYKALENGIKHAIETALGIQPASEAIEHAVVWADLMALQIEAANLMSSRGRGWSGTLPDFDVSFMNMMPKIKSWRVAYDEYLSRYKYLAEKLGIENFKYVE